MTRSRSLCESSVSFFLPVSSLTRTRSSWNGLSLLGFCPCSPFCSVPCHLAIFSAPFRLHLFPGSFPTLTGWVRCPHGPSYLGRPTVLQLLGCSFVLRTPASPHRAWQQGAQYVLVGRIAGALGVYPVREAHGCALPSLRPGSWGTHSDTHK